jgi:hypothetical protein
MSTRVPQVQSFQTYPGYPGYRHCANSILPGTIHIAMHVRAPGYLGTPGDSDAEDQVPGTYSRVSPGHVHLMDRSSLGDWDQNKYPGRYPVAFGFLPAGKNPPLTQVSTIKVSQPSATKFRQVFLCCLILYLLLCMGLQLCTVIVCLSIPYLVSGTEHWNVLDRPATAANWCLPARAYQPPPTSPYLHAPRAAYLLPLTLPTCLHLLPLPTSHILPVPLYLHCLHAHQILASWSCWMPAAW